MNLLRSLRSVMPRLKFFWLAWIVAGAVVAALAYRGAGDSGQLSLARQFILFASGAWVGLGCSAFFAQPSQFLLRGSTDMVYLVSNRPFWPALHALPDRETVNALSGVWHEITHVSELAMTGLFSLFGRGQLSLIQAPLCGVNGQASVFAILLKTRYGIPNPPTLHRIWGPHPAITYVDVPELDKWRPGRDLMSVEYWPLSDREPSVPA